MTPLGKGKLTIFIYLCCFVRYLPIIKGRIHMIGDWIDKVEYPQLPSMSEDELISFFEEAQFARLGTINEDGTIHIAPIFFKYDEGRILMATQDPSRKVRNIKRNNNVTVLIDTTDVPFRGVLIYGTAELDYEDVVTKRITIFKKRLSQEDADTYARRLSKKWKCVILRISPVHITSFDYSKA
jgi:nitroimidazol reductase NimA-like FMN-containing flavoprotein (pyridoxamine 5'-phosphate oxidase superfamily)